MHITNGDISASLIRQTNPGGQVVAWRDVLYEGPVPGNLSLKELSIIRAKHLSETYGRAYEKIYEEFKKRDDTLKSHIGFQEVVLWFDQDVYSQLQLFQILDWFGTQNQMTPKISLICVENHLEWKKPEECHQLYKNRTEVRKDQLDYGVRVWKEVTSDHPKNIEELFKQGTTIIPFIEGTLKRYLEEFPSIKNGLSKPERQFLKIIFSGDKNPGILFQETLKYDLPDYMADWLFWKLAKDLSREKNPLIRTGRDRPGSYPPFVPFNERFKDQTLVMTKIGEKVLENKLDRIKINGLDRHIGGTHLKKGNLWRWDKVNHLLIKDQV